MILILICYNGGFLGFGFGLHDNFLFVKKNAKPKTRNTKILKNVPHAPKLGTGKNAGTLGSVPWEM